MNKILLLAAGVIVAGGVASFAAGDHAYKKIYEAKCASCHGKDLKGNPMMAKALKLELAALDLTTDEARAKTDEEFINITAKGAGKMPGYEKTMKAEEIQGLIDYIRSIAPAMPLKDEE